MRISDIFEEIGDGDDLIEQLKHDIAVKVTTVYNTMKLVSNNFTLLPDKHTRGKLQLIGIRMFLYRGDAIRIIGADSNTVRKINIVLNYIKTLK